MICKILDNPDKVSELLNMNHDKFSDELTVTEEFYKGDEAPNFLEKVLKTKFELSEDLNLLNPL